MDRKLYPKPAGTDPVQFPAAGITSKGVWNRIKIIRLPNTSLGSFVPSSDRAIVGHFMKTITLVYHCFLSVIEYNYG
jgi:hypothetical protein